MMVSTLKPIPWKLHLGLLAVALAFPFVFPSSFMVNFGVLALFYAFIGQSWNIAGGFAGQLSFGHVVFFGVGAYVSTILQMRFGFSPWLGLPASAVGGAGVSSVENKRLMAFMGIIFLRSRVSGSPWPARVGRATARSG